MRQFLRAALLPGEAVRHVTSDKQGAWQAEFPAMAATTGLAPAVTPAAETLTARNLAVGDGVLRSGQSNMHWPMRDWQRAGLQSASPRASTRHWCAVAGARRRSATCLTPGSDLCQPSNCR
jgi:hypothetical protein